MSASPDGTGPHRDGCADGATVETGPDFHLFVYGTLRSDRSRASILRGCERIRRAVIEGTLYQLDEHPALILYGSTPVRGEVWRCPADLLGRLDEYEGVGTGLFRRVGLQVGEHACWTYVAGPALSHRLTQDRRMDSGDWTPAAP
jgi:gamma-glutamylcyclotransferase (GGCT)/AIG2-like uncharacterized protein YtfP